MNNIKNFYKYVMQKLCNLTNMYNVTHFPKVSFTFILFSEKYFYYVKFEHLNGVDMHSRKDGKVVK